MRGCLPSWASPGNLSLGTLPAQICPSSRLLRSPGSCWQPGDQRDPKGQPVHSCCPPASLWTTPQDILKYVVPMAAWGSPTDRKPENAVRRDQPRSSVASKEATVPGWAVRGYPCPSRGFLAATLHPCCSKSILGGTPGGLKSGLRRGDPGRGLRGGRARWPLRPPGPPQFSPGETQIQAPRAPSKLSNGGQMPRPVRRVQPGPHRQAQESRVRDVAWQDLRLCLQQGLMFPASGVVGTDSRAAHCS